jgi:hypothetical protein
MQNRVLKGLIKGVDTTRTYYIRDAQGNVMAVYTRRSDTLRWTEQHLYGSGRLGMYRQDTTVNKGLKAITKMYEGKRQYELSNHLGNVLTVINDRRTYTLTGSIRTYDAVVLSAQDYYPFGMGIDARSFTAVTANLYRYGMNGQEKTDEITAGHYTAMYWEYDSRIARRWNVDPKPNTTISNYAAFANSPLLFSDSKGDTISPKSDWSKNNKSISTLQSMTDMAHFIYSNKGKPSGDAAFDKKVKDETCSMCCLNVLYKNLFRMYKGYTSDAKDDFTLQIKDLKAKLPDAVGSKETVSPNLNGLRLESGTTPAEFNKFSNPNFRTGIVDNLMDQMGNKTGLFVFAVGLAADYHSTLIIGIRGPSSIDPTFIFVEDNGGAREFSASGLESKLAEYYRGAALHYGGAKPVPGTPYRKPVSASMEANIYNLENIEH